MRLLQESLEQRSSPVVYCFPLALRFIRTGEVLFGLRRQPIICFPVHSLTGCVCIRERQNIPQSKVLTSYYRALLQEPMLYNTISFERTKVLRNFYAWVCVGGPYKTLMAVSIANSLPLAIPIQS